MGFTVGGGDGAISLKAQVLDEKAKKLHFRWAAAWMQYVVLQESFDALTNLNFLEEKKKYYSITSVKSSPQWTLEFALHGTV